MRTRLLMLVFMSAFSLQPAFAQPADAEASAVPTAISFMIDARLPAVASDDVVPLSLIDRLEAQPALTELRLESVDAAGDASSTLVARFSFGDMQAFRQWYEAEATKQLLAELRAEHRSARVQYSLLVQRRPSATRPGSE